MKVVYYTHSLRSCWNHGNAHFVRGVLRELKLLGLEVEALEPETGWSLANLLADHGPRGLEPFQRAYPDLASRVYASPEAGAEAAEGADVVVVHEWSDPRLVARLSARRRAGAGFRLLFHDTHHRAVSDPEALRAFDLDGFDGVLAFGAAVAEVYRRWGWGSRVFVWHEAADVRLFKPPSAPTPRRGLVWIGNWGDGERERELDEFLFRPAEAAGLPLDVYGVRYPAAALEVLRSRGASHHGWLPNARAPEIYAGALATVHVPRRFYRDLLPGVPTIRVFEALACGLPLLSAPWRDAEGLFRPGEDFLTAADGAEMTRRLGEIARDADLRAALAASGRARILARHTCGHRARELLSICSGLGLRAPESRLESA